MKSWWSFFKPRAKKDLPPQALDLTVKSKVATPHYVFTFTFPSSTLNLLLHRPHRSFLWSAMCEQCSDSVTELVSPYCDSCGLPYLKGDALRLAVEHVLPTDPLTATLESYDWVPYLDSLCEQYKPRIMAKERQLAQAASQIEQARRQIRDAQKQLERQSRIMTWDLNAQSRAQARTRKRVQRKIKGKHGR